MDKFIPGEHLSAAKLNRLVAILNKASNLSSDTLDITVGRGGITISNSDPEKFFAKITGNTSGGSPYSWAEAVRSGTSWTTPTGLRSGTLNAYEVNGQVVATGKVVELECDYSNDCVFRFNRNKAGCTSASVCFIVNSCCGGGATVHTGIGATITVYSGATVVATLVASLSGSLVEACTTLAPGSYTATLTGTGIPTTTIPVVVVGCSGQSFMIGNYQLYSGTVYVCNSKTVAANIVVTLTSTGASVGLTTSDATTGQWSLCLPPVPSGDSYTFTVTVTDSTYASYYDPGAATTDPSDPNQVIPNCVYSGGPEPTLKSTYVCCALCVLPIPKTLSATFYGVGLTLTYVGKSDGLCGASNWWATWTGCFVKSVTGLIYSYGPFDPGTGTYPTIITPTTMDVPFVVVFHCNIENGQCDPPEQPQINVYCQGAYDLSGNLYPSEAIFSCLPHSGVPYYDNIAINCSNYDLTSLPYPYFDNVTDGACPRIYSYKCNWNSDITSSICASSIWTGTLTGGPNPVSTMTFTITE